MTVYGIKTCASVKKARAFFDQHHIEYQFIDISKVPVEEERIKEWSQLIETKKLLNPRSKPYREMKLKEKKLNDQQTIQLLAKENMLIKRPIIEHGLNGEHRFTLGFNEQEYHDTFLA